MVSGISGLFSWRRMALQYSIPRRLLGEPSKLSFFSFQRKIPDPLSAISSRAWLRARAKLRPLRSPRLSREEKVPAFLRQDTGSCLNPVYLPVLTAKAQHIHCPQSCEQGHAAGGKILCTADRKGGGKLHHQICAAGKSHFWRADICCRPQARPSVQNHRSWQPCTSPRRSVFLLLLFEIYVLRETDYTRQ